MAINVGRACSRRRFPDPHVGVEKQTMACEEVEQLLGGLAGQWRASRPHVPSGRCKSYQEISTVTVSMPENSIGPILSRAREKLRRAGVNPAVS